jgi:hypothetical protein
MFNLFLPFVPLFPLLISHLLKIFQYISNKMQRYTVYLYLETALHVSCSTSTHNQERIQLFLRYLAFCHTVTAILQPFNITHGCTSCCLYTVDPPDDEQQTCSKHVEAYYWNKLKENCASCWFIVYGLPMLLACNLVPETGGKFFLAPHSTGSEQPKGRFTHSMPCPCRSHAMPCC